MGLVQTLPVISQDLDDAAVRHPLLRAAIEHLLDLGAKRDKPGNLGVDLSEVLTSDGVRLTTGLLGVVCKSDELADGVHLEPKFASMPDELKPFDALGSIGPPVALCPRWGR